MGPVCGRRFEPSVKFDDVKKPLNAAVKLHAGLDSSPTANGELVSNMTVWSSTHNHIKTNHNTTIPAAASVFLLRCECSGTDVSPKYTEAARPFTARFLMDVYILLDDVLS